MLGERELAPEPYERESDADWLTGAFMFLRREALEAAGMLDERFFMSSEETDLCFRVKEAGYRVVHLPSMTILHHAGKRGTNPRMDAQYAFARRLFAEKHFAAGTRTAYLAALGLRYGAARRGARPAARRSTATAPCGGSRRSCRSRRSRACARRPSGPRPPWPSRRAAISRQITRRG